MKRLVVALAVALSFPAVAGSGFVVFGNADCGQWFEATRRASSATWLAGYLSGLSTMYYQLGKPGDPLDGVQSQAQINLWMDNWCREHPLETVASGGQALFMELIVKSAAKR